MQAPALLIKLHQRCPELHTSLVAQDAKLPPKVQGSIPAKRFLLRGGEGLGLELEGQAWDNSPRATSKSANFGKTQGQSRK